MLAKQRRFRCVAIGDKRGDLEFARLRRIFSDQVRDITEIDKEISNVDQTRSGVRAEPSDLDAAAFVSDRVDRIDKIFVARYEYRRVVTSGERQHIHGDLYVEIRLSRAVVERFQLLLDDAETVSPHPQEKSLLTFSAYIDASVKEGAKEPAVSEQDTEQLVVIDIDVMKPGRVEKIVAVNENGNPAAVAEFPRRTSGRLELHCSDPQIMSGLPLRCSYKLLSDMLRILIFLKSLSVSKWIEKSSDLRW